MVNRLSGRVFGISFPQPLIVKTNIVDVVKFSYLKDFLSKDVQESIRGLLITNENYILALQVPTWKVLQNCNLQHL